MGHLGGSCALARVRCPDCEAELPRAQLAEHRSNCIPLASTCPWGCGARLSTDNIDRHKGECLMDPQKLMAAISQLARENALLST